MKRRYLRPSIQLTLMIIDFILFVPLALIDDYVLEFTPIYASGVCIALSIAYILAKYGKWEEK